MQQDEFAPMMLAQGDVTQFIDGYSSSQAERALHRVVTTALAFKLACDRRARNRELRSISHALSVQGMTFAEVVRRECSE